jgi:hypothetical protein
MARSPDAAALKAQGDEKTKTVEKAIGAEVLKSL